MPRPCGRAHQPYLKILLAIATNEKEPTPLRLRAAELALAIRTGEWQIAASRLTQKAVRELTAQDSIDRQLLEITGLLKEIQQQQKGIGLTPEEKREAEIDALPARAEKEKKEIHGTEQS